MPSRTNEPYKDGELEVILSLPPTSASIYWLSKLLDRSEKAIEIVYKIAFGDGPFSKGGSTVQQRKIVAAKKRVEIRIGLKRVSRP